MPHPQPGMPTLLKVMLRPAETHDKEGPQPLLRTRQVLLRIERSEDVVAGHATVEGGDQAGETLLADDSVNLGVEQVHRCATSPDSPAGRCESERVWGTVAPTAPAARSSFRGRRRVDRASTHDIPPAPP